MSELSIGNQAILKHESINTMEFLEKCGEVYLERQLGNLIYLCTLCDDKFEDVGVFSKHISDIHLSIESFITYEPDESGEDDSLDTNRIDQLNLGGSLTQPIKEELDSQNHLQSDSDASDMEHEQIFHLLDKPKTVLDIQLYVDDLHLDRDIKEETLKKEDEVDDEEEDEEISLISLTEPPSHTRLIASDANDKQVRIEDDTIDLSDKDILCSKLKCKFCGDQFDYVKQLRKHDCGLKKNKKIHHCTVCGKMFKKKSGLDIHALIHNGEKPHKCDICGTAYACKQNLIVHIRRHTGEKPFKCDYCDRRFASSTEKISHMRTHTGERPFVCELCGKAHTSSSQLTEHMHRHLDIRKYVCEVCDKRFRNSYNLRMHRLTHEDAPRNHHCQQCLSSFKTQNNLLQHMKIHQKEKKYICKICGRAFAQHPGLYSHMKSHAISK